MSFRICDSVLGTHSWNADGRLCIKQQRQAESFQQGSPKTEIEALFTRLLLRSRWDRVMYRAATRLNADPSIPLGRLAADLGVTERYLLSGLRAALGVDPHDFIQKARRRFS
jgi:AraC-like DNA-binding protein